jgi:uncharacterized metal-binding protein
MRRTESPKGKTMKKKNQAADCANCPLSRNERLCLNPKGKAFRGCPSAGGKKILSEARKRYDDPVVREFARQASIQEGQCYAGRDQKPFVLRPTKTRIEEICEFANKMGYQRLGLAFCVGLAREAKIVAGLLTTRGFHVVSVICKVGAVPKEEMGLTDKEKIRQGQFESMCNPVAQAMTMNDAGVEFNILLGLCVGHDSLFFKHADAPTTVLAVKDRVTGHNPLAAIYLLDSYYARLKEKG